MPRVHIALIPPFSLASKYTQVEQSQHFLFLPQYLLEKGNIRYKNNVKYACTFSTGFTILDNGAFEGELVDPYQVEQLAAEYGIDEVVVTDVIRDAEATFELVKNYHKPNRDKRYMAVVQGKTTEQCEEFIRRIATSNYCKYITTLGLPKHLLETCEDRLVRIRLTRFIRDSFPQYAVHFLGASPLFLQEIKEAAHFRVRSLDTSLPFVYAYHKTAFAPGPIPVHSRPEDYFRKRSVEFDDLTLSWNIHVLQEWANGEKHR